MAVLSGTPAFAYNGAMSPPSPASPHPLLPIALLFAVGALWGFFFVLIKTGVSGGIAPMNYLFWFSLIAGTVVLAIAFIDELVLQARGLRVTMNKSEPRRNE